MNSSEGYNLYVRRLGARMTYSEYSMLALYYCIAFVLLLFLLLTKRKFLMLCFSHLVYLTPLTLISHFAQFFLVKFPELAALDSNKEPSFTRMYVFLLTSSFSVSLFPTIPFTVTMMYAIFFHVAPKPKTYFLNINVTENRIIVIIVMMFVLIHLFSLEESQFTVSISPGDHFTFRVDMLKFFLAITTTCLLLRKFHALMTVENPGKMDPREYAHVVHVALFVFIFWVIFLTQVVAALLYFSNNQSFHDGNHFGYRDSIIMQYVFVFSTLLASSKTINKVFNRSKVVPVDH